MPFPCIVQNNEWHGEQPHCPDCIEMMTAGQRRPSYVPGVHCDHCSLCLPVAGTAYMGGVWTCSNRCRPSPDSFERIVGVPLDAWIDADTPEKFAALLAQRDESAAA